MAGNTLCLLYQLLTTNSWKLMLSLITSIIAEQYWKGQKWILALLLILLICHGFARSDKSGHWPHKKLEARKVLTFVPTRSNSKIRWLLLFDQTLRLTRPSAPVLSSPQGRSRDTPDGSRSWVTPSIAIMDQMALFGGRSRGPFSANPSVGKSVWNNADKKYFEICIKIAWDAIQRCDWPPTKLTGCLLIH